MRSKRRDLPLWSLSSNYKMIRVCYTTEYYVIIPRIVQFQCNNDIIEANYVKTSIA